MTVLTKSELASLEHKVAELNNDSYREGLEDIANFEKDFRALAAKDQSEMSFLKIQANEISVEKNKVHAQCAKIETRI